MGTNCNMLWPQLLIALGFHSATRWTPPDGNVAEDTKPSQRVVVAATEATVVARPESLGGIGPSSVAATLDGGFELLDVLPKPRMQPLCHIERHRDTNLDLPNQAILALPGDLVS
jgi:hypothetical protein